MKKKNVIIIGLMFIVVPVFFSCSEEEEFMPLQMDVTGAVDDDLPEPIDVSPDYSSETIGKEGGHDDDEMDRSSGDLDPSTGGTGGVDEFPS